MKRQINLAEGNVEGLVMRLAVPMVAAQLVSMLYNIVDRIFVGRIPEIGAVALGGIGIYLPINILFMAVSLLFGGGGAPQASIALGSGDKKRAEEYLGGCVLPLAVLGIFFGICLYFFGSIILPVFGATPANLAYALEYVRIVCIGIPFSMMITGMNIFINAQGKTLVGMVSVMIGAAINLVLDAVFILVLNMGVSGAAWATVIGQVISAAWVIGFLCFPCSAIRIRKKNLFPSMQLLGNITSLGISNFITTGAESLINILLNASLRRYGAEALNGYGVDGATLAISVGTIVTATSSFIRQPVNGFCQGVQPVISYNYGAGRQDRVRRAIHFSILVTTLYAAAFWLFMMKAPEMFAGMFTDSADVAAAAGSLIRFYVFGMIFSGVQSTLIQAFVGRGMKKYSLFVSLFSKGLYVPLLLIFPLMVSPAHRLMAVYAAQAVTDLAGVLFIAGLYIRSNRQLQKN